MKNLKQPNEEEFFVLKNISTNDSRKKVRLRAEIILLRLKEFSYRKIAKLLKCGKDTIRFCVEKWNNSGIGSIVAWKRNFHSGKQFKRRNVIERLISNKPMSLKFHSLPGHLGP